MVLPEVYFVMQVSSGTFQADVDLPKKKNIKRVKLFLKTTIKASDTLKTNPLNFSKVTENVIITIKLLIFFHIFSDVAIGPENSPSLN